MFLLVKCIFATKKTRKYDNAEKLFFDSVLHQKNPVANNPSFENVIVDQIDNGKFKKEEVGLEGKNNSPSLLPSVENKLLLNKRIRL